MKNIARVIIVVLLCLTTCVGVVAAASVTPTEIPGNPTCSDLGYNELHFKVDGNDLPIPAVQGTYYIDAADTQWVKITTHIVAGGDAANSLDWESNFDVDAVIVKGGPVANLYAYSPPSQGDFDLRPPINPANGKPYGLSHVDFCFPIPVPEFPSIILPATLIIGFIGAVLFIQRTKEQ